jgi:hypothetical protein
VTSCRPVSISASSARLMVWEGRMECISILTRVSVAGWVAATSSDEEPPLLEPSM